MKHKRNKPPRPRRKLKWLISKIDRTSYRRRSRELKDRPVGAEIW